MLEKLITWSLANRAIVMCGAVAICLVGFLASNAINYDAFPDTTPVQVQINTTVTGLVPEEVEKLVTFPVELAISGMAGLEQVRSVSQFGLSQVTVTFKDGTPIYFARQLIAEKLSQVRIPDGIERPEMGPVSTGLGEVFHYLMYKDLLPTDSPEEALTAVRTVHDWEVKPLMRQVPGTAEINSWGGYEKQYQVRIDPKRLINYDLTFHQVIDAVKENNLNVGGGNINNNKSGEMLLVHGVGRTVNVAQIEEIVVETKDGVPILLRDVADVVIGHEIRRGLVTGNGRGEVVLGLGFMLLGENSYKVTRRMKDRMDLVKEEILPLHPNMQIDVVYDRTELVDKVIATVKRNLMEAAMLVITVLYVIIANLRAGLIVATAIPISMLFAFCGMWEAGIAGTLLSLGAIDFGVVVESNVVVIENVVRRLAHDPDPSHSKLSIVRRAAIEVRQPAVFGQLIIMIVYVPLLTLEGVEGKMFRPMAWTLIFLLIGSLICSLTVIPVLASFFMQRHLTEDDPLPVRIAKWLYRPVITASLKFPYFAIALGVAATIWAGYLATQMGTEFVPRLSEGSIVIGSNRTPGTDLEESIRINTRMEKILLASFPAEIDNCWMRTGAPEVATDPGGVENSDLFITLTPRETWTCGAKSQAELVELMDKVLLGENAPGVVRGVPGQDIYFTQPIEQRINEMVSGVRSDVALKVFGDDFPTLVATAKELATVLKTMPGCVDLLVEQVEGQPILEIKLDRDAIARYGLSAESVLNVVESIGSKPLGTIIEGQLRFPVVARLPESYRDNAEAIAAITITTPLGVQIPLERLANISVKVGPRLIPRERNKRRVTVMCNVRGVDIGTFVAKAQERIKEQVKLPAGYVTEWGGQFENMKRAQLRLSIVVPVALVLIVLMLYATYRNVVDTAFVFTSVPFAAMGGIIALWLREMPISISASVGFITLAGVSVLNNMVVVSAIRDLQMQGLPKLQAITDAAMERLRTRMMTAMVAIFGFLPMATSSGVGAEVQRPLATVVIGGVVSSTLVTLFVLPALYLLVPSFKKPESHPEHNYDI